ncbi:MAG: T9SS type A sorting domain-containing protein [Cyclobacteriaceae bacterium]
MRSVFYSWLAVISPFLCHAQDQSPRVVNAMGLYQKVENVSLEASIGEIAVSTLAAGDKSIALTQGFLQPLEPTPCDNVTLESYPNPTRDFLTITVAGCDNEVASVEVVDIWGRSIDRFVPVEDQVDLTLLSQGVYVLKVQLRSGLQRALNVVKITAQ